MTTIEVNDLIINVPESPRDVTLGTYEKLYKLKPEGSAGHIHAVEQLCNLPPGTLRELPVEVFNEIVPRVMFAFGDNPMPPSPEVLIDGIRYIVPAEDEITLGMFVDVDGVQRAGVDVLSNTLAIVCRPAGEKYDTSNNEARAKMFAAQKMDAVLPVFAFFLHCKKTLERLTAAYGSLQAAADLLPPSIKVLRLLGVGTKISQMHLIMTYCASTRSLRARLRKFSPTYSTARIKTARTRRKEN